MNENDKFEQEFSRLLEEAIKNSKAHKPSKYRLQNRINTARRLNKELQKKEKKLLNFSFIRNFWNRQYLKPALALAASLLIIIALYYFYNLNQTQLTEKKPQISTTQAADTSKKIAQETSDTSTREIFEKNNTDEVKSISKLKLQRENLLAISLEQRNGSFGFADSQLPLSQDIIFDYLEKKINKELGQKLIFTKRREARISEWFYLIGLKDNEIPKARLAMKIRNDSLLLFLEKTSVKLSDKKNLKEIHKNKLLRLKEID